MNFFVADVQTGFGTFVAFYLAHLGWSPAGVGLALTFGGLAGVLTQVPGGALADAVGWKRGLAGVGIAMIGIAALIFALVPSSLAVTFAEVLHGATAGIITPAIGAISLGLVGRRGISLRTGRNYRYAAAGHAITAAAMGFAGDYFAPNAIFIAAALLCVPALIALGFISPQEIDYARARNAASGTQKYNIVSIRELARNRSLVLFMAALVVFQLADASMLPLVGEQLAATGQPRSSLFMSGLIIIPQIVVALFAPWVGYHSEKRGRRPLLLIGFGLESIRAATLALSANYGVLAVAQLLDGVTGAIIGVLTVLVISDLTAGTGRFNLARGTAGALVSVAGSISTLATGFLVQGLGRFWSFCIIAIVACAATALIWLFLSERAPKRGEQ